MVDENFQDTTSVEGMEIITRRKFFLFALAASLMSHMKLASAEESGQEIPYRYLGKTGEKVSAIGLGGYHMGIPGEAEGIRIVRTAIDSGINFMDNCWDYHSGGSESRMGKALKDGYRDKVFLMTKVDGRDRKTAAAQIDQSLKRLQTDRIDLMQIHEVIRASDPPACFEQGGAIEALIAAKKAGKIRYIGFTGHKSPEFHLKMLQIASQHDFHFDAVQMPLNVMDAHYDSFEQKVLPVLLKEQIAVLGMKPFGNGVILNAGIKPIDCLRYALSLPTSVVITGCDSMKILEQALSAVRGFKPLTGAERKNILEATLVASQKGEFEIYKTTSKYDGTTHHPEWLG
jgi:predicted aldo/keto reductase-like oxidoreductase